LNKIRKNQKSAFSLLEISIVLTILAVIFGMILALGYAIDEAKLAMARKKTTNSSVHFTKNLVLWLDTTNQDAFDENEAIDEKTISEFKDINPQLPFKKNAVQNTQTNRPTYVRKAINGLPALEFDGSNDFMILPFIINPGITDFTAFIVAKFNDGNSNRDILQQTDISGTGRLMFFMDGSDNFGSNIGNVDLDSLDNDFKAKAYAVKLKDDALFIYSNNNLLNSALGVEAEYSQGIFYLGCNKNYNGGWMDGFIGEVIIFNRALKTSEQTSIEEYLMDKWNIN